jgi:hypothetical protein
MEHRDTVHRIFAVTQYYAVAATVTVVHVHKFFELVAWCKSGVRQGGAGHDALALVTSIVKQRSDSDVFSGPRHKYTAATCRE